MGDSSARRGLAREPSLRVIGAPGALRRRTLQILRLTVVMAVFAGGTIALTATGRLGLPFERVVTLKGRLASVGDLFDDPQVQRILLEHGLRVQTRNAGSREVAEGSLEGLDFVFPSGKSAADLVHRRNPPYSNDAHPFTSPLVLATYRPYAEALVRAGAARPAGSADAAHTLYYTLDMSRFLGLSRTDWTDIGSNGDEHGLLKDNPVVAQTSNVCESNSAGSYLALVAYTVNHGPVQGDHETVRKLAREKVAPLLDQGSPGADLFSRYKTAEGRRAAPIVVVYEHQYLAYQARYRTVHPSVDTDRVLLYPTTQVLSEPYFIALDHQADVLGELLEKDDELGRRETQLGYRINGSADPDGLRAAEPGVLTASLERQHVPPPPDSTDLTSAKLPETGALDEMITEVGHCKSTAPQ